MFKTILNFLFFYYHKFYMISINQIKMFNQSDINKIFKKKKSILIDKILKNNKELNRLKEKILAVISIVS